jgi:hypothetical protein
LNVHCIKRIDPHPAESNENSISEIILDTDNWIDCCSDLEYQINTEKNLTADNEFHIKIENGIINPEC